MVKQETDAMRLQLISKELESFLDTRRIGSLTEEYEGVNDDLYERTRWEEFTPSQFRWSRTEVRNEELRAFDRGL